MKFLVRASLVVAGALSLLVPLIPSAPGASASGADQTYQTFTSSLGVSSQYHSYAAGIAAPVGLLFQFHGDGAYEFTHPTSSYSLGGTNGIVANARSRGFITIPVLSPDKSSVTWWSKGSANASYTCELIAAMRTRFSVSKDNTWLVGYSGGAQFITQYLLPTCPTLFSTGGSVVFGGGGAPAIRSVPTADLATLKAGFRMHWYTGAADIAANSSEGYDALGYAKKGEAYYTGLGFKTSHQYPAGVTHKLDGIFGGVVGQQLDLAGTPLPPTTPPTTPTAPPTSTTNPTPPPVTSDPSNWVTAVVPTTTGVRVTVNIPTTESGRTTLTVYNARGNYWYTYTNSTGVRTLSINTALNPRTGYTFTVIHDGTTVGSGSFTTTG